MAIKPQYAYHIKQGTKTIELRKRVPRVNCGDVLVIYESAPISNITAYGIIRNIFELSPCELWKACGSKTMIDKTTFFEYFYQKETACGIEIECVKVLREAKRLECISKKYAPQSYYYITNDEFRRLIES